MPAGSSASATLSQTNGCYGSIVHPITLGSARSNAGGGSINLVVGGALTLNGKLLAETADHNNYPGSGGSVYVKCHSLAMGNEAAISADSGRCTSSGAPGGGGRVAVIAETGTIPDAAISKMTANAGRIGHTRSTAGTVFVQDSTGAQLVIRGYTAAGGWTPVRNPSELPATLKRIKLERACNLFFEGCPLAVNEIVGEKENGDAQPKFRMHGGSLALPHESVFKGFNLVNQYGDFAINLADSGTLTVTNGATMTLNTPTTLAGSLTLFGTLNCDEQPSSGGYTNRIDLTVTGDMTIASGGQVDVTLKGNLKEKGPGASSSVEYGGAYGGTVPGLDKDVYGSILHPTELGSSGTVGGAGGAVKLTVGGTLTVASDGWIRAYGTDNNGGSNASGGSVWLTVGQLAGSGTIDAKGGNYRGGTTRAAAGGSGGRIAVRQTVGNLAKGSCGIDFHYDGGVSTGGLRSGTGTLYWETAAEGLDHGTVYYYSTQLPPVGMPLDELTNSMVRVGATTALTLIDDAAVGDFYLPAGAALNLAGHTLKVVSPAGKYRASVLGTVDESQGGTIDWPRKGFVFFVR